jgi:hypothetical protein
MFNFQIMTRQLNIYFSTDTLLRPSGEFPLLFSMTTIILNRVGNIYTTFLSQGRGPIRFSYCTECFSKKLFSFRDNKSIIVIPVV